MLSLARDRSRMQRRAWVPTILPGCPLWLRADLGVTLNGSTVSAWANQGTLGGSCSQGTGAAQPTWSATGGPNSRAGLSFDGGDYLASTLAASAWNFLHSSNFTLFYVWNQTATGNAFYGVLGTSTSAAGSRGIAIYWDNRTAIPATASLRSAVSNGSAYVVDPGVSLLNNGYPANSASITEHTYEYLVAGDDYASIRNGTTVKTAESAAVPSASNAANTLNIGIIPGAASNGLVGSIAEVIAFNRTLAAAERSVVRRYLSNRYAITVS